MHCYKVKENIKNNRRILITTCNSWLRGGVQAYDIYISFSVLDKEFLDSVLNIKNADITLYAANYNGKSSLQILFDKKNLFHLMKKNKYDVIHVNTGILWFQAVNLFLARHFHIKNRIAHSHNAIAESETTNKIKKLLKRAYHSFLRSVINKNATSFFACSDAAGVWLYGKKKWKKCGAIQKNGILVDDYKFNPIFRDEIRNYYSIPKNAKVLGLIASFNSQKNQKFLIDVFNEFIKIESKSYLVLVGEGENKKNIEKFVQEKNINNVIFTGSSNFANKFYSAFDIFVMTSFFEGLPFVAIEAQCSALPCVLSDTITKEVQIGKNVDFVSLTESPKIWCEKISNLLIKTENSSRAELSTQNSVLLDKAGYNLNTSCRHIESIYKGKSFSY